ncbi:cupin domain-containing protein [Vibrio sp. Isolate23]|uniref:cupin domain-containing protein n=1 Tax=Vibrio TaxID=662 RepID=UPI001EFC9AF5|nr:MULTISPECIES: cupin domain-containing protein [Vibrio]MCG9676958.1 cupin domain-containing protein [Vibrio sp. Isolate24]MCG9681285.1 cupin domain-containing protein [Vibrio sp. Isolate23]USD34376.1 cupin domain-containing protein [Vibrio sp. SCSIO 43186]USD47447.1 cupin domain-containing protein [Vibrio sp. SCSIO 43145]USD71501.1 cupin domain-containing protein [Vibrio sp. SCSIO 43139]
MNLLQSIPEDLSQEVFEDLLSGSSFRLERIVSKGQSSEQGFWYDQDEHEWVIVLTGYARLQYQTGEEIELKAGDHLKIPAHTKHRVSYTTPDEETIWLAIFYKD